MIADMAAMAPEARAAAGAAMLLERSHRYPEIVRGLFGAEEWRAAPCEVRAGRLIIVTHGFRSECIAPRQAADGSDDDG